MTPFNLSADLKKWDEGTTAKSNKKKRGKG